MWPRLLNFALGIWLMSAPFVLGYHGTGRTNDVVVGTLVCVNALLVIVVAANLLRWVNVAIAVWLLLAPWYVGFGWSTMGHRLLVGVLILSTALVRHHDAPAGTRRVA